MSAVKKFHESERYKNALMVQGCQSLGMKRLGNSLDLLIYIYFFIKVDIYFRRYFFITRCMGIQTNTNESMSSLNLLSLSARLML